MSRTLDVADFFEKRKLTRANYVILAVTALILFFDGLDMVAMAFVAPYASDDLGLASGQVATIFSVGNAGLVLGGLLFGWLADRHGRRPVLLLCSFLFAALTTATAFVQTYEQLVAMRFVGSLAIGGVPPLCIALNTECVSRRVRATVVTVIMVGYSLGAAAAGPLTNWVAPEYGWRAVFLVAGAASFVAGMLLIRTVPESVPFLLAKDADQARALRALSRFDPAMAATDGAEVVLVGEERSSRSRGSGSLLALFEGRMRWLTPLLWISYSASYIAVNFLTSWNPTLFETLGLGRQVAGTAAAIANFAGAVVGLILMRFTDRLGPVTVIMLPAAAFILLAAGGVLPLSAQLFLVLIIIAQTLITGGHFGILSISPLYYSTSVRASGTASAISVGKTVAILSPFLGAALIAYQMAPKYIYAVVGILPAVFALAVAIISIIVRKDASPGAVPRTA